MVIFIHCERALFCRP